MEVLQTGGLITAGIVGQKLLAGIIRSQILDRVFPAAAAPAAAPAAGLGGIEEYNPLIAGALAVAGGMFVTNMVVKDTKTKTLIMGGFGAGFIHSALIFLLDKLNQPAIADMLAGEGTAARISAMYGLGAGVSLQPHYAPIGMGEYFSEGMSGLGAAPALYQAAAGMGAYGANPDIYQAAAGYGDTDTSYGFGNHVSPSSDLERELTIAEAAAGVGAVQSYEASAGTGEYFSATGEYFSEPGVSGLGAIQTTPAADTWVPGMANPQLWAGVKSVGEPQSEHMMLPAGVLETAGGAGIFG
jgi:hypothetical protein